MFHKIHREIAVLETLSNTIKYVQTVRLATLLDLNRELNRDPRIGVSEPAICSSSAK